MFIYQINFSPYSNNPLDHLGKDANLFTVDGRSVVITKHNTGGFFSVSVETPGDSPDTGFRTCTEFHNIWQTCFYLNLLRVGKKA